VDPTSYKKSRVADVLGQVVEGRVRLSGWVVRKTQVGGVVFVLLRDGTGYLQVSAKKGVAPGGVFASIKDVPKEAAVSVMGQVRADSRAPGGRELSAEQLEVVATAEPWPITKTAVKAKSFLLDKRHLSIRGPKAIATMKIRAEVIGATFDYFRENGFWLISAPTFVGAAVEGGSTLFEVGYFGKKAYLSQSAQFYEEASLPSLEKVWIFQPAFRAEKSKTPKHLTEFWMIESEQAFADQTENMVVQEELLAKMIQRVVQNRQDELKTLGRSLKELSLPLPRITYDEALAIAKGKGVGFEWGEDITSEAEKAVSRSQDSPFFITDYPLSARSFYHMTFEDRPKVTKSADLMAPEGYGELATGGQRIHDYKALMERITSQELPAESFGWYLELRKFGMPPHVGFGMGVERVTRWAAGLKTIRSASLFPRTVSRISP
jgi:asparaginyl-tRNA synthetase